MRNRFLILLLVFALATGSMFVLVNASASQAAKAPEAPGQAQLPGNLRELPTDLQPVNAAELDGVITYVPMGERAQTIGNYMVQLADAPVAELWIEAQSGGSRTLAQATAQAYTNDLLAAQAQTSAAVEVLGGKTLANFTKLVNGIAVEISSERARDLLALPGVVSVSLLPDFEMHLDETVPWIGADVVQSAGFDGSGITVAVLDSGMIIPMPTWAAQARLLTPFRQLPKRLSRPILPSTPPPKSSVGMTLWVVYGPMVP